jgi:hypothetical protein
LAGGEAALWLQDKSLMRERAGEALSRYEVEFLPGSDKLREVTRPRLFETSRALPQPRLFALDALGQAGWLMALRLADYARGAPAAPRPCKRSCSPNKRPEASPPASSPKEEAAAERA